MEEAIFNQMLQIAGPTFAPDSSQSYSLKIPDFTKYPGLSRYPKVPKQN